MNAPELLEQTQRKLNISLSEHLEKGINELLSVIDNDSNLASDVYQMRGKFYEIEQDSIKGIIKYDDKMFYSNKVRVGILEIIGNLTVKDFTIDCAFWSEEEKTVLRKNEEQISVQVGADQIPTQNLDKQSTTTLTNQKIYSIEDLELIKAEHNTLLVYYSVVYREISTMVFRGSNETDRISKMMIAFNSNKEQLQQFKDLLSQLKAKEIQLAGHEKEEYFKILLRRMVDFKSKLHSESMPEVQSKLLELKQLEQELKNENT